ncbi:MAG: hypothetical protein ABII00_06305 [Elusimicrobiota bacterium]
MILFCPPARAELPSPDTRWVFLGKSAARRDKTAARLGRPPSPLKGLLHREADRLRGPFLDWVAALGKDQADPAAWWAGTLPWKAWSASDLFLLACYQALCLRLAETPGLVPGAGAGLTVVVEDPWLLAQLAGALKGPPSVRFSSLPGLRRPVLAAISLGIARRVKWALRMALSRALQVRHSRQRTPLPGRGGVLIYTHLLARSLEGKDGWKEFYLPGLDRELAAEGIPVLRCTYPDTTGWERELAARQRHTVPLILYSSWPDVGEALLSLPPRPPRIGRFDGQAVDLLLEREWWHDLSRAGRCAYLLLRACAGRFLRAARWRALIFPWESQPQERMIVLAARESGVRTVGYQHTTVPRMQMPLFAGRGEDAWAPLPDIILTSGPHPTRMLERGGLARERLRLAGSRRYPHLAAAVPGAPKNTAPARGDTVLVLLPVDRDQSLHMLAAFARAYPNGGDFRILVKPHPATPVSRRDIRFPAEIASGDFPQALERCGLVVFSGSTAGLEALLAGRRVLRYRPETLLDFDPSEILTDDELPTAGDGDLRERLEELRRGEAPRPSSRAGKALGELFSPVEPKLWLEAVAGTEGLG